MRGAPQSTFSRLMVRINTCGPLGTDGRPGLPWRTFQAQNRRKAIPVPADDGRSLDNADAGLPIVPDRTQPSPQESIRRGQLRSLDRALQNAELMAEREDLELERRTALGANLAYS